MSQDRTPEQSYFVRIIGGVDVVAESREAAMEKGRRALAGEVPVDPHIQLGVTDAWVAPKGSCS